MYQSESHQWVSRLFFFFFYTHTKFPLLPFVLSVLFVLLILLIISTTLQADCIFVLDKGTVVEQGTHTELVNKPDRGGDHMTYRKLVERQTQ